MARGNFYLEPVTVGKSWDQTMIEIDLKKSDWKNKHRWKERCKKQFYVDYFTDITFLKSTARFPSKYFFVQEVFWTTVTSNGASGGESLRQMYTLRDKNI